MTPRDAARGGDAGVPGGTRDGAATARFWRMLAVGGRFANISHEGLSTGGLNFENGANCEKI